MQSSTLLKQCFSTRFRVECEDNTDPEAFLPGYCFECKKPGHWACKCPDSQCSTCGEDGHTFLACPEAKAELEEELENLPQWNTNRRADLEELLRKFRSNEFPVNDIVYRALRPDEEPHKGIFPPARPAPREPMMSIADAIGEGSTRASHFIHTSRSRGIALMKYAGRARLHKDDRVAVIDLSRLPKDVQVINGTSAVADAAGNGRAYRFATADSEVVLKGTVPPSAIIDVLEFRDGMHTFFAERSLTPPKHTRRLEHDVDWRDNRSSAMKRRRHNPPTAFNTAYPASPNDAACNTFKVAGVSYRQDVVNKLKMGDSIVLRKDDANIHDKFAVQVVTSSGEQIGFVEKERAFEARSLLAINGKRKGSVVDIHRWSGSTGVTIAIHDAKQCSCMSHFARI